MWPPAKVDGVWPFNDAWLRTSLSEAWKLAGFPRTPGLWVATNALPRTGGHPFYQRLNEVLDQHGFDAFVEAQCATFYAPIGRPSLLPGTYFRLLLIG